MSGDVETLENNKDIHKEINNVGQDNKKNIKFNFDLIFGLKIGESLGLV